MDENRSGENRDQNERIEGDVKIKLPVSEKLSNFWYYYKWHTIVAIFLVVVAVIITVSIVTREKYDVHIVYAGDKSVSNSYSDGDIPERMKFLNSFKMISSDYDGNGEVNVAFKSLYAPDAEERKRREENNLEIPDSLIYEDNKALSDLLAGSDYYLMFLDYAVFEKWANDSNMIATVEPYIGAWEGRIATVNNSSGIYLADTAFYSYEGINKLPEDTIVCLKYATALASDADKEKREDAIEVFKKILAI